MNTMSAYLNETRFQMLSTLRMPSFVLPTFLFPAVFYCFFGIFFARKNPACRGSDRQAGAGPNG